MADSKIFVLPIGISGKTVTVTIVRLQDNYLLDDADGTFGAAPGDSAVSATESPAGSGVYVLRENRTEWSNAFYQILFYEGTNLLANKMMSIPRDNCFAVLDYLAQADVRVPQLFRMKVPYNRLTAAVAANSYIWGMRYNGIKKLRLRSAQMIMAFDGTAAASESIYQVFRFSAANLAGGTTITGVPHLSTLQVPSIDARYNYAATLTSSGVSFESNSIMEFGNPRQLAANNRLELASTQAFGDSHLDLTAGQGICFKLGAAAVIGDSLGGYFEWEEVPV